MVVVVVVAALLAVWVTTTGIGIFISDCWPVSVLVGFVVDNLGKKGEEMERAIHGLVVFLSPIHIISNRNSLVFCHRVRERSICRRFCHHRVVPYVRNRFRIGNLLLCIRIHTLLVHWLGSRIHRSDHLDRMGHHKSWMELRRMSCRHNLNQMERMEMMERRIAGTVVAVVGSCSMGLRIAGMAVVVAVAEDIHSVEVANNSMMVQNMSFWVLVVQQRRRKLQMQM